MWTIWLIAAIIFLVIELVTPTLVSIWFSLAAFIMSPISLIGLPIYVEIIIFLAISIVALILLRRLYIDKIRPKNDLKDNLSDKILLSTGIVTKTIDNSKNEGQIIVGDIYWKAISDDDSIIEKDEKVSITKVLDTKVFVKKNN